MSAAKTVYFCCDTGCVAGGASKIADSLKRCLDSYNITAKMSCGLKKTGCHGFCENGPLLRIMPDDICYYQVKEKDIEEIVKETIISGKLINRLLYKAAGGAFAVSYAENPFYKDQQKVVLKNVGLIDPLDIEDYISRGGYEGLRAALAMKPEEVVQEVEASGLRGRGGAGFPTGRKWRQCASYQDFPKYVICNCDEGDPGAFMDRSIFEGDPHSVLEGMTIAAYAVGAEKGFVYVRDEYAATIRHIQKAIEQAREKKFLGGRILNTGMNFDVELVRGGGAFVCGESSALMASVEGRVGEPRSKYIRSVEKGLWNKPTVLNNVETLANVPLIIKKGAEWFKKTGTAKSPGTKVFTLVGKVMRTGLVEVPMGVSLRSIIFDVGGGMKNKRKFKAVQTGGPSGGCIPERLLDLPVDFDTLTSHGSMMGSGGMIVMDDRTCMVEVARYYIKFLSEESCGKCTPCREGLRQLLTILTAICEGRGKKEDLALIETLCETLAEASLCSLGKSAANPVLTTMRYFAEEYEEHIEENYCRAGVCSYLTSFKVDGNLCTGCGQCLKNCPVKAISRHEPLPAQINAALCVQCGQCREVCAFEAVVNSKEARLEG